MTKRSRKSTPLTEVIEHLGLSPRTLAALRDEGLFEDDRVDPDVAEELRLAHVLIEQLGVNAAGVHVTLHMRRRMIALESRVTRLTRVLETVRDDDR